MKVALLIQNNLWFCPYINIYTEVLREWSIDYDLIFWNRDNKSGEEGISYYAPDYKGRLGKLLGYWNYGRFLTKVIKRNKYDRLIVFSPQIGIFISSFLKKEYHKKYIFDYRDLSIEQYGFLSKPFKRLLDNSYANVISSSGFKRCLPESDYIISHNFIISEVRKSLSQLGTSYKHNPYEVLTIGGIRDFESNKEIIGALSNNPKFSLRFVGRGSAQEPLQEYANNLKTKNIFFEGYYKKEDEPKYVLDSSFMNIFYPDKLSHATALSNRFYNSLIYRRPMIVTKGQIQGDYAEKYNVGIAVDTPSNLTRLLDEWIAKVDIKEYEQNCIKLLSTFVEDYDRFKSTLKDFLGV